MNENSLNNLKPFKKGQSGNPAGKKPGTVSLTTILREKLAEGDGERAKQLVEELLLRAGEKSDPLMKEILDRTEGKVPQAVEGKIETELTIKFDSAFNEVDNEQD
jgi:hypothetical protein